MQKKRFDKNIPMSIAVLVLVSALACLTLSPTHARADASDAEAIVKDLRLQTELPKTEKITPNRTRRKIAIPAWIAYLLMGLFAVLVAVTIGREMNRRGLTLASSRQKTLTETNIQKIREAHSQGNIGDYIRRLLEELAGSTDFAEAVHRMLLEAITIIKPSLDFHLSDAFTSREIIDRLELPQESERNLAVIIEQVERSHFGGLDVTREQFERCLGAFRSLVLPQGGHASG